MNRLSLVQKVLILIVIICAYAISLKSEKTPGKSETLATTRRQLAYVTKISDGDTVRVSLDGKNFRARLLGIDAPESEDVYKAESDARRLGISTAKLMEFGNKSKEQLKKLLPLNQAVTVELAKSDKYGRALVKIYNAKNMHVNLEMLRRGFAKAYTKDMNSEEKLKFLAAEDAAREQKVGFWATGKNSVLLAKGRRR